jgi:hypothetical protein
MRFRPVFPNHPGAALPVHLPFLDGLEVGSLVCAGIALTAAVVVAILLPPRDRQATAPAVAPDPAESVELSN